MSSEISKPSLTAGGQGETLLAWPDATDATDTSDAPDAHSGWAESFELDSPLLADIIRDCSAKEMLPTAEDLYDLFRRRLPLYRMELEAARAAEEPENTTLEEAADADEAAGEAEPKKYSRRELFSSFVRIRQRYLDVAGEAPEPLPADARPDAQNEPACSGDGLPLPAEAESAPECEPAKVEREYFDALLALVMVDNEDLCALHGLDGNTYYHCKYLLSATFAEIMTGKSDPALLICETVRKNSRDYPRPISIEVFEYPPFDLTPEVIQDCLEILAADPEADDIDFVTSSVGTIYLYSKKYLDGDYAEFIAENLDLGMVTSP